MEPEIKILAHRGGMARAPENTIAGFRQAYADGADAFECDVTLTKDDEPVILHTNFDQDDIRKATGCTTPLRQLNWTDVRKLTMVGSREPVPHLDEVLAFVQETGFPCIIEPKARSETLISTVVNRIQQSDLVDKIGMITFHSCRDVLVQAKHLEPRIQTSVIIINPTANFLATAKAIDADRIVIGWSKINHFWLYNVVRRSLTRKVRHIRSAGIGVEGGFIRTRRDVEWALRHEIWGLWADDVPKIEGFVADYHS